MGNWAYESHDRGTVDWPCKISSVFGNAGTNRENEDLRHLSNYKRSGVTFGVVFVNS